MSDAIDKPGTPNLGSQTPVVQEAPKSSSGTELTMETLDTISAAGVGTMDEVRLREQTAIRNTMEYIVATNPNASGEAKKNLIIDRSPGIGFQGDSNA